MVARGRLYVLSLGTACALGVGFSAWGWRTAQGDASQPVEEGTFQLHKFEQRIGEEKYSLVEDGDELRLSAAFHFNDRGRDVPLDAFLRAGRDLVPRSMEVHGYMARGTPIDNTVLVEKDRILTRDKSDWHVSERPAQFFTIAAYAPAALQTMLVRMWLAAGGPKRLKTFPAGDVLIEDRGRDEFALHGTKVSLERFGISDLVWGRETLWLDSQNRLAALVTVDGEYDHFEAIRPEFGENLGAFVQRAAADEMAALAEISKDFRQGQAQDTLALVGATLVDGHGQPSGREFRRAHTRWKNRGRGPS